MKTKVERQTVDLPAYPDLVVIYLGMRVNAWAGLKTLLGIGPQIKNSVDQKPDGLLLHENFIFSLIPLHVGMRQYWRDFDADPIEHRPFAMRFGQDISVANMSFRSLALWLLGQQARELLAPVH